VDEGKNQYHTLIMLFVDSKNIGQRKAVASSIAPALLYLLHPCSRKTPNFGAQLTGYYNGFTDEGLSVNAVDDPMELNIEEVLESFQGTLLMPR
jgi:hypothetical protein